MKRIGRYVLVLVSLCIGCQGAQAQRQGEREGRRVTRIKLQEQKYQYLIEKLELSPEEGQALQAILRELDTERYKLWQVQRGQHARLRRGEQLSEEEYKNYLEALLDRRVEEAELERFYYKKCKDIIPASKLLKLQKLNREFAKQFLHSRHRGHKTQETLKQ